MMNLYTSDTLIWCTLFVAVTTIFVSCNVTRHYNYSACIQHHAPAACQRVSE